jgi:hypothetical protein
LIPYSSVVDVGVLPPGDYSIRVRAEGDRQKDFGRMTVAEATSPGASEPDDKLYAIIDEVNYDNNMLTLKGKLPGGCTRLKEVVTLARKANIVEVLPLAEVVAKEGLIECSPGLVSFERKVPFKAPWTGPTLFHVRSLNGQAINKVLELK